MYLCLTSIYDLSHFIGEMNNIGKVKCAPSSGKSQGELLGKLQQETWN